MNPSEKPKKRKLIEVPRLAASKSFGKYKDEKEIPFRTPGLTRDCVLKQFIDTLMKVRGGRGKNFYDAFEYLYSDFLEAIKDIQYTAKDVEDFYVALEGIPEIEIGSKVGLFLSALVNNGKEENHVLKLGQLGKKIDELCFHNIKNVTIKGNVGCGLGYMQEGKIHVMGSCGDSLGCNMKGGTITIGKGPNTGIDGFGQGMCNGKIIIKGDVDGPVGENMQGGTIIIFGSVGGSISSTFLPNSIVGHQMSGGEIHLFGKSNRTIDLVRNECIAGGKIFNKGKLIVDK